MNHESIVPYKQVGYQMVHPDGEIGFSWNANDIAFNDQWTRVPMLVYDIRQPPLDAAQNTSNVGALPEEKPTGGNVNYYLCDIKEPKRLAPYKAEAEDIIEALGMTFAEGCAFKAIWRSCAARTLGVVKPGMDKHGIYDAEKVVYYGQRMLAQRQQKKDSNES